MGSQFTTKTGTRGSAPRAPRRGTPSRINLAKLTINPETPQRILRTIAGQQNCQSVKNLVINRKSLFVLLLLLSLSSNTLSQSPKVSILEARKLTLAAGKHEANGEYTEALALYDRALKIKEAQLGEYNNETAEAHVSLGAIYQALGDTPEALVHWEQALNIRERVLDAMHPDMAASVNNLASLYASTGNYAKALPLFERAHSICKQAQGLMHPNTAASLNNLAAMYSLLGQPERSLALSKQALDIWEEVSGPNDPNTAAGLSSLAGIYDQVGDFSNALPLRERAVVINEKFFGASHPRIAGELRGLAATLLATGDIASARRQAERALGIDETSHGEKHPSTAASVELLGSICAAEGNLSESLRLAKRALLIREISDGPQHPLTSRVLERLAITSYLSGDSASAASYASKVIAALNRQLQSILSLEERARLSWQAKNLSYWYACVLRPEALAQLALRWKGAVLDSLFEDRVLAAAASIDSKSDAKLKNIALLRVKLGKIVFDEAKYKEAAEIEEQIGQLQRSLANRSTAANRVRLSADLSVETLIPALSGNTTLVDFIRFEDPKRDGKMASSYGAIILGSDGVPAFVRIEDASALDSAIDTLRAAITAGDAACMEEKTKMLSERLWEPIATQLPKNTKRLFICPDAKLNFLSFGTLLEGDGSFAAERYPITYVGSARDLAREPSADTAKSLSVFAAPIFEASVEAPDAEKIITMRSAEAGVFGTVNLPPLPGTKVEAEQLEVIAAGAGWDVKTTTGEEATESRVREAKSPGVLHLATHGFYLNAFSPPADHGARGMSVVGVGNEDKKRNENGVDPMRASGVALTGAQETLKLWNQRKAPDPETDGILTAEDVASLDLNGTWLVTLSACETGVGEARSGEGVFGLRRAFMMAGAENLLMTLWPVADDTTASIMADFYKEALATGDAPGSLAKVQRDWLVKLREEKGLAAAIREAGPFAMVMMTAPSHPPVELPVPSSSKSSWWPF
jgi:CHAT domain-containing protein/tetratricopeptide (TPR) repeat protein